MTGRDLLDAIGYVDESLVERCQKTEQIVEKSKIAWSWYSQMYVTLAVCAGVLIISILAFTYGQYNFSGEGGIVAHKVTEEIMVSSNACYPEETEHLPKTDTKDGSDSAQTGSISNGTAIDTAENTLNETDQELTADVIFGTGNDDYPSDSTVLPDTGISPDMKSRADIAPKDFGNTDITPSTADKIAKNDKKGSVSKNYSQGIRIESVTDIPKENPPSGDSLQPGSTIQTDEIPSVEKILARNTVIIRGTVKKIRHFHAKGGQLDVYFSVVSLKVKDVYRADGKGSPQKGKICKIYLPDTNAEAHSGSSILRKLTTGSEAIIMPYIANAKTGIHKKGKFLAILDVSDYYFNAQTAESHIFLKTRTNILYDDRIYDIPYTSKKVTLNDIGNYLNKLLKKVD